MRINVKKKNAHYASILHCIRVHITAKRGRIMYTSTARTICLSPTTETNKVISSTDHWITVQKCCLRRLSTAFVIYVLLFIIIAVIRYIRFTFV